MNRKIARALLLAAISVTACATNASAGVIIDDSPDAIGSTEFGNWSNDAAQQNFLVQFSVGSPTTIGGMDIYSSWPVSQGFNFIGTSATVKLRDDDGGVPAVTNLFSFAVNIDAQDGVGTAIDPTMARLHVDFAGITLAAGSYWIGMSDTNGEIGWSSLLPQLVLASQWQLDQDNLQFSPNIGQLAFRIDGVASEVPEPQPLALLGAMFLSLLGVMFARRQRLNF